MKKVKAIIPFVIFALVATGILIFLFIPRSVEREAVTPEEYQSASDFLLGSLDDYTLNYQRYLERYNDKMGK